MKNIQVVDAAENATLSIFQATDEEFAAIFPDDRDIELAEDFQARVGAERAAVVLMSIWERPILKRETNGVHGTLYYGWENRRRHLPSSKREVDWDEGSINEAQRRLFRSAR